MVAMGHEVSAAAGEVDDDAVRALSDMGVDFHPLALNRRGISFSSDIKFFRQLLALIHATRPDVVLCYTIKPVVYGSVAAYFAGVPFVAAMITGAGTAQPGDGFKGRVISRLSRFMYRCSLRNAHLVFFQNSADEQMFREFGAIKANRVVQIHGSGVDVQHFTPTPIPDGPVTFLMVARLLVNKGVSEFARAAEILKNKYGDSVRFVLVGSKERGDGAISEQTLFHWSQGGFLDFIDQVSDVRVVMSTASVYVLPSYREGTPRTVLEAMAMARPVVTTDVPGCRETVQDGINGFLVPAKDPRCLASAMEKFVIDRSLIDEMGARGRRIAVEFFDVRLVNDVICKALGL